MGKETAESKLLKLIEQTDAKTGGGEAGAASAPAAKSTAASSTLQSMTNVGTIQVPPVLQNILKVFSGARPAGQPLGMPQLNLVLLGIVGLIGMYLFMDFVSGIKTTRGKVAFEVKQMPVEAKDAMLPVVKDVGEYLRAVSERNVFRPFEKKVEEAKIVAPIENQQIKDKVANLKLVGISWMNSADTAMALIEDKSTSSTEFKRVGDEINGVKIDTIYADRVEMSFQGEKLTMNL